MKKIICALCFCILSFVELVAQEMTAELKGAIKTNVVNDIGIWSVKASVNWSTVPKSINEIKVIIPFRACGGMGNGIGIFSRNLQTKIQDITSLSTYSCKEKPSVDAKMIEMIGDDKFNIFKKKIDDLAKSIVREGNWLERVKKFADGFPKCIDALNDIVRTDSYGLMNSFDKCMEGKSIEEVSLVLAAGYQHFQKNQERWILVHFDNRLDKLSKEISDKSVMLSDPNFPGKYKYLDNGLNLLKLEDWYNIAVQEEKKRDELRKIKSKENEERHERVMEYLENSRASLDRSQKQLDDTLRLLKQPNKRYNVSEYTKSTVISETKNVNAIPMKKGKDARQTEPLKAKSTKKWYFHIEYSGCSCKQPGPSDPYDSIEECEKSGPYRYWKDLDGRTQATGCGNCTIHFHGCK